jgi:hypothetical protein
MYDSRGIAENTKVDIMHSLSSVAKQKETHSMFGSDRNRICSVVPQVSIRVPSPFPLILRPVISMVSAPTAFVCVSKIRTSFRTLGQLRMI